MKNKFPRILYFIGGAVATEEEESDAVNYGGNVAFRNAGFATAAGMEKCDGVAGNVPECYAKAFPAGDVVIAAYTKSLRKEKNKAEKQTAPAPQAPVGIPGTPPFGPPVV